MSKPLLLAIANGDIRFDNSELVGNGEPHPLQDSGSLAGLTGQSVDSEHRVPTGKEPNKTLKPFARTGQSQQHFEKDGQNEHQTQMVQVIPVDHIVSDRQCGGTCAAEL
jgi:hypothetical protein